MNQMHLSGRLATEPIRRETTKGVLCTFRLAVGRAGNNGGRVWIDIDTWGHLAGTCAQHLVKGRQVLVTGRLTQHEWTTAAGEKKVRYCVAATTVEFLDSPANAEFNPCRESNAAAPPDSAG